MLFLLRTQTNHAHVLCLYCTSSLRCELRGLTGGKGGRRGGGGQGGAGGGGGWGYV